MPSVIVRWRGRCPSPATCRNLAGRLAQIAEISHSLIDPPFPIIRYRGPIKGKILVADELLGGEPVGRNALPGIASPLHSVILPAGASHAAGPPAPRPDPGRHAVRVPDTPFVRFSEVRLEGIEFQLWGNLYPDYERISFVSATFPGLPALDGTLVRVDDRRFCRRYDDPLVQAADYYLSSPSIHLRYYCEKWIGWLLGWVKRFYIPDLWYWNYQHYRDWKRHRDADPADIEQRNRLFEEIVAAFNMEIDFRHKFLGDRLLDLVERRGRLPRRWAPRPYTPIETDVTISRRLHPLVPDAASERELAHQARLRMMEAGEGYSFHYLSFRFRDAVVASSSRLGRGRHLAIEFDLAPDRRIRAIPEPRTFAD